MTKYIIKNCPAYNAPWCGDTMNHCSASYCVIKEIIKICYVKGFGKQNPIADDILSLLKMERKTE